MRKVEVMPHDPSWRSHFEHEAQHVTSALGPNVIAIHHIGSTAIAGIYAKPIIDILVAVQNLIQVDLHNAAMENVGYEAMGEFGIPDRRYFRKDNQAGIRTHHVHVFQMDSPHIQRHLRFRDYLIAHPDLAQEYSALKQKLAAKYPTDINQYMDGKHNFIQAIDQEATIQHYV